MTLKGTVTKVDWTNPHVFLFVDVPDKRGKTANWESGKLGSEWPDPGGVVKESLKAGDTVTIEAYSCQGRRALREIQSGDFAGAAGGTRRLVE